MIQRNLSDGFRKWPERDRPKSEWMVPQDASYGLMYRGQLF